MSTLRDVELPPELEEAQRKATFLERLTLAYMASAIVLLFLTLGQSQAMKAAWIEDLLSLLPPAAFLLANRYRKRPGDDKFRWGYHRAISLAYLAAAVALLLMGVFVFADSAIKLLRAEHPPIGLVELFGVQIWLGWLMIAALLYSGIPPVFLGRAKLKLAQELHEKVLYADAEMNKADWMTVAAAIVGIVGIGFGLWWADGVAALFISVDIVHDGFRNVRAAGGDLMDRQPRLHDDSGPHPIADEAAEALRELGWVEDAWVRLREEGHVFAGEAHIVPTGDERLLERVEQARDALRDLDWRLHDIVVVPVRELGTAEKE